MSDGRKYLNMRVINTIKGKAVIYDLIEDGDTYHNGIVTLDKKWIKPCINGENRWHPIIYVAESNIYRMITNEEKGGSIVIHKRSIELADEYAFETIVLGEDEDEI